MKPRKKILNATDVHVGTRVRARRMMMRMSQASLGNGLNLTFQQVQKYEKGVNRIGASRLQQIANILQVPVSFFFEGAPDAAVAEGGVTTVDAGAALINTFLSTQEGPATIRAMMRITKRHVRTRFVSLLEAIAGEYPEDEATAAATK